MTLIQGAQAVMTLAARRRGREGGHPHPATAASPPSTARAGAGEKIIDATDCVVYPAWVNTHHHLFQTVMKGVPGGLDMALRDWLINVRSRYRGGVDEDVLRISARLGMVELMLSGCATIATTTITTIRHRFDGAAVLFEEAERLGVRFVLCRGGMTLKAPGYEVDTPPWMMPSRSTTSSTTSRASRTVTTIRTSTRSAASSWRRRRPPTACARRSCFSSARRAAPRRAHALASLGERRLPRLLREKFGMRPVEHCAEHEWLGRDVWFAHLCHVSDSEIELMARAGTGIAHCPGANCRLGSGIAPAPRMQAAGMPVSLGVDGAAANEPGDILAEAHSPGTCTAPRRARAARPTEAPTR